MGAGAILEIVSAISGIISETSKYDKTTVKEDNIIQNQDSRQGYVEGMPGVKITPTYTQKTERKQSDFGNIMGIVSSLTGSSGGMVSGLFNSDVSDVSSDVETTPAAAPIPQSNKQSPATIQPEKPKTLTSINDIGTSEIDGLLETIGKK